MDYTIINGHTRSYVISVAASNDYLLLEAITRSISSLNEDFISGVVASAEDIVVHTGLLGFIYDYPAAVALFSIFSILIIGSAILIPILISRRKKGIEKENELKRFVSYICGADETVAEVNLESLAVSRYGVGKDDKVAITNETIPPLMAYEASRDNVVFHSEYDCLTKELTLDDLKQAIIKGTSIYFEARCEQGGKEKWFSYLLQPVEQSKEHPLNYILYRRDVDATKKEEERKKQALSDALVSAESSSAAKGSFLSKMSHEIRTPLNAIIGYISMAQEADGDKAKIDRYMVSSGLAAKHLLNVINDVLDMSAIESGRLKIANDSFDIKTMLSTIASIYDSEGERRKIQFRLSIKSLTYERFFGDELRVNQVLMNLLSNAMKFTDEGGHVNLTVKEKDGANDFADLSFEVADNGRGMSKKFLWRLFVPFEQESASTARLYGGSGLGLSITKNLVGLMGGSIDVQSEEGKGSTFTVVLPFKIDRSSAKKPVGGKRLSSLYALVVDDEEGDREYAKSILKRLQIKSDSASGGEEALKKVLAQERLGTPYDFCLMDYRMPDENGILTAKKIRAATETALPIIMLTAYDSGSITDEAKASGIDVVVSKPLFESTLFDLLVTRYGTYEKDAPEEENKVDFSFQGIRVLLAEDNDMNLEIAKHILEKEGIIVTVARDGKQAVDAFLDNPPKSFDAILMDIQMPGLDGYEATKAIRSSSHSEAKTIPILAMTADAFNSDVAKAIASGMNDHIAKPIDKKRLFRVLAEQIIKNRKAGKGL